MGPMLSVSMRVARGCAAVSVCTACPPDGMCAGTWLLNTLYLTIMAARLDGSNPARPSTPLRRGDSCPSSALLAPGHLHAGGADPTAACDRRCCPPCALAGRRTLAPRGQL